MPRQSTKEANAPPRSVGRARSTMHEVLDRLFHTYRLPLADVTWHQSDPPGLAVAFHGDRHVCGRPSASQRDLTVGCGVSSGGLGALRRGRGPVTPPLAQRKDPEAGSEGQNPQRWWFWSEGGRDQCVNGIFRIVKVRPFRGIFRAEQKKCCFE